MDLVQTAQHADDLTRAAEFYSRLLESEPTGRFERRRKEVRIA